METIASLADATSTAYAANREAQLGLAGELRERLATAALGGPAKSRERHVARGKLLARERIDMLLDPGAAFLEFAAWPRTCTTATLPEPGSSPGSAWCTAGK